ncbi:MAG TPA: hypothetical protein VI382_09330 [Candidatus Manganitrophaceae bacterium]|nr:hypothetical protein [Candidatus Manganitrophaceae bacterium]
MPIIEQRSRPITLLIIILWSLFAATTVDAKEQKEDPPKPEVPKIIFSGLGEYGFKGAEAVVKVWMKGSALEESVESLTYVNALKQAESIYGNFLSSSVAHVHPLTTTTLLVYLSINYEKGPLFARFLVYRAKEGWIIPEISFNTKPELILPPSLLAP